MLNPRIAEALRLVGYNIRSVEQVFGNRPGGVKDPEIIEWCAENSAVWLTADIAAKRRQEQQTKLRSISVVWYHSPKQGWSTMQQHWIITKFLQRIATELRCELSSWIRRKVSATTRVAAKAGSPRLSVRAGTQIGRTASGRLVLAFKLLS